MNIGDPVLITDSYNGGVTAIGLSGFIVQIGNPLWKGFDYRVMAQNGRTYWCKCIPLTDLIKELV